MLKSCIDAIKTTITGLGFIGRYGGLVRKVSQKTESGKTISYPVACSVSDKECWEQGRYSDLTPNDAFNSVAYWEFISGMKTVAPVYNGHVKKEGMARFVCWVNIAKLNFGNTLGTECSVADDIQMNLERALNNQFKFTHRSLSQQAIVRFELTNVVEQNSDIFSRYSYKESELNIDAFCIYPYEVMAFDFKIYLDYNANCVTALTAGTAIDCVTY